jgi:hypothetical protein
MTHPLDIIIVERLGSLKLLSIKDFKQEELYKKCGFKKPENFNKQTEWNIKYDGKKYFIQVFAKIEGRANSENKYDFPPPIDTKLFYGSCAIVGQLKKDDGNKIYINMSLEIWNKIYEKLFGGFEDLSSTAQEDEEEEDELANIPKEKKTKQGYLKDGFVVDSSDTEYEETFSEEDEENNSDNSEEKLSENELIIDDIGSELSEESYDYDDK